MTAESQILALLPEITTAPLNRFAILQQTKTKTVACLRFNELLDSLQIKTIKQELKIPLFDLYFFESLSILSAYVFHIPVCNVDCNPFFLKLYLPSAENLSKYNNVKLILQDSRITVFHSDDGACLVSINGLKRVIKPLMVRRSEKNMFEGSRDG